MKVAQLYWWLFRAAKMECELHVTQYSFFLDIKQMLTF